MIRKMELLLDDDDFDTIQAEITRRQVESRKTLGEPLTTSLPEGESCLAGAVIAECIRDLIDYRDIWESEHPIDGKM